MVVHNAEGILIHQMAFLIRQVLNKTPLSEVRTKEANFFDNGPYSHLQIRMGTSYLLQFLNRFTL